MPHPITIEGAKYFVSLPTLKDLRTFQAFLQREHRRAAYAAIPSGLPDDELRRWMRVINEECDQISPINPQDFARLATNADGAALLFHGMLRQEQPTITLDWVAQLIARAEEAKPGALDAMRELREAMVELIRAKKNEPPPAPAEPAAVERETVEEARSTSIASTST